MSKDSDYSKILMDRADDSGLLDFDRYSRKLSDIIMNSDPNFTVGIFGGWGTGKTTLMRMMQKELRLSGIPTVWFDAWRYEREDHLAVVPFLRTFCLALEEFTKPGGKKKLKDPKLEDVKRSVKQAFVAFLKSSRLSIGVKDLASVDLDFNELLKSFETMQPGSNVDILYYDSIRYLEVSLKNFDGRIVIFIDDLDRCNPEKGLEVLESIKNLFDINGLVFVIGMDYNTINSLVRTKFPENKITGFDYVKKIVQLPFHIPDWLEKDIDGYIDSLISKDLKNSELMKELLTKDRDGKNLSKELLIKAVESNPREIKRFVNHIILAKAVFDKPIRNLIVVQGLKFRRDWVKFLDFISPSERRRDFLLRYKDLVRDPKALEMYKTFLEETYPTFQFADDPLRKFLDAGAKDVLMEITDMEPYRRSLQVVSTEGKRNAEPSLSQNSLGLSISEAYARDDGKGVARIDYDSMDALKASTGDVVEIKGNGTAVAKVLPLFPSDEGKGMIRIDEILKEQVGAQDGSIVVIKKTEAAPAQEVLLEHIESRDDGDISLSEVYKAFNRSHGYLGATLSTIPVIRGSVVVIPYFESKLKFKVNSVVPEGVSMIVDETRFRFDSSRK